MRISIIVAVAENNAIGKDNDLIWRLPADLKHFKNITMGHHMLMGRKNFESIGRALPGRVSIIVTRQKDYKAEGCFVVGSIAEGIDYARENQEKELMIIGGGEIYKETLDMADTIYLTRVHETFEADVFFPEINDEQWKVVEEENHQADDRNPYNFSFLTLKRISV